MLPKAQAFFTIVFLAISLTASARIASAGSLATEVDLLLVLATDVSNSVDEAAFQFQRKGYAAAITSPFVIEAIQSGPLRRIAVCYIEWSGVDEQKLVVDWTVIEDAASASRFSQELATKPRAYSGLTSVGMAIDFAAIQIERSRYRGMRRVIDVAGDGDNSNSGPEAAILRDKAVEKGITINALVVLTRDMLLARDPSPFGPGGVAFHTGHLEHYYRHNVIGGPGAFVLAAVDFAAFTEVIAKKLISEIAGLPIIHVAAKLNPQCANDRQDAPQSPNRRGGLCVNGGHRA